MQLSIIIVSYNVKHYVEQCLHSIYTSIKADRIDAEVFVVDNDSTDNTAGYLAYHFPPESYPTLHILANARNVGFGRANNQALRRAKGEHILFLNPDTLITEHTLHDMLTFAEAHPDMGALGVRMLNADGRFAYESRRGVPTAWVSFCKMAGLCALFPKSRIFGRYYMRYLSEDEPNEIEIISGACMMCKRTALDKVGSFDEDFFMYGEDIDLSYRLLQGGYHNYYIPSSILHYKGESTKKNTYRYVHIFYEAMLIFYKKHFSSRISLIGIPVHIAIYARALLALLHNQINGIRHFINMGRHQAPDTFLYDATAPYAQTLEDIAERNGINLVPAVEGSPTPQESVDAVIFNTDETSYEDMLRNIRQNANHDYALGTFNPNTKVLIACHQSYV